MFKTFQYRLKDSNNSLKETLLDMGYAVNRIWNNANEEQIIAARTEGASWPSAFDLDKKTSGWCKHLDIPSTTVQSVNSEYVTRRKQFRRVCLRWRSNNKSLTWIPFKKSSLHINRETGRIKFQGLSFDLFYSRPLLGEIKSGSITRDSRNRFYINIVCELPDFCGPIQERPVGIDLGLKDLATLSDGTKYGAMRYYRKQERRLALAQSNKDWKKVRKINCKVKNQRRDFNHKVSNEITNKYSHIFVGDVSSADIIQIHNMAKSVYDVSWFQLKSFLRYKALAKGKICREVSEKWSTQTCSECGSISSASPKGRAGLNVREWVCPDCGAIHDRDINAAKNILRSGYRSLH